MSNSTMKDGYTRLAVLLHWLLAAALLYQLALGWWMLDLPKQPAGLRAGWFNWHKSVGLAIALVVVLRLAWRLRHPVAHAASVAAWQQRAARAGHGLLYACMLGMPLTGYLGSSFSGYPVKFFGRALPSWAGAWPAGKQAMSSLHYGITWVFMGLIALHVGAALWHGIRRDGVLQRMLPFAPHGRSA